MAVGHLYELVVARARDRPREVAFGGQQELGWRTLDGREVLALVDRLAAGLAERGVAEGDRVVVWAPGGWRTPLYLFALWKLGAVVVPFDRDMNPSAAGRILAAVEPRCVLAGYVDRPAWTQAAPLLEWWEPDDGPASAGAAWSRPAEELAAICYTSGSTGDPKGCQITHANLCFQVGVGPRVMPLDASCRLASILPLSHLFELTCGLLYPFAAGAAIHYVPSRRGPDIVRVLSERRITHMLAVPQLLTRMGQALDEQLQAALPARLRGPLFAAVGRLPLAWRRRLFWPIHRRLGGQLRMFFSGGAALPPETQRIWERLGIRVVQGYGCSECSPVIACGAADGSTPPGSVGRAIPGVDVRLSPEGELLVRGPNVMRGYWKEPERTAEVLRDGWYATGDLATIDAVGNIRLVGRARELIALPSGLKVWPQDVEDALRADPAVRDAAVLAVPNPRGGARLHAYLLPADPAGADPAALRRVVAAVNRRLAAHQRVGSASWWPEEDFPRTATLKVRRHLLPAPDEAGSVRLESEPGPSDPLEEAGAAVERDRHRQPLWPYTWGRRLRFVGFPIDALYRLAVTRTVVLGQEHLVGLPSRLIVAGTHHGFADLPLVRRGLRAGGPEGLAERLVVATGAEGVDREGLYARYGILAFGLYPLRRLSERDSSLRDLVGLMESGSALLIFPQGTHARPEQERADDPSVRFRSGVSHLAAALDAAVLPFGVAGTEKVVPPFREGFEGRVIAGIPVSITRGPLAIAFGPPLRRGEDESPRAFAARLQESSYALTRQAERALEAVGEDVGASAPR